jgi:hypothetical protein
METIHTHRGVEITPTFNISGTFQGHSGNISGTLYWYSIHGSTIFLKSLQECIEEIDEYFEYGHELDSIIDIVDRIEHRMATNSDTCRFCEEKRKGASPLCPDCSEELT